MRILKTEITKKGRVLIKPKVFKNKNSKTSEATKNISNPMDIRRKIT